MNAEQNRNLAASIHQRLRNHASIPGGLTDEYWDYQGREIHLRAFARCARVSADAPKARALLPLLREFLLQPLAAARDGQSLGMQWEPGGPWAGKTRIGTGSR